MIKVVHQNYFGVHIRMYIFFYSLNTIYSTGINGVNTYDIKTWPLADSSSYFVIGYDGSNTAKICKYSIKETSELSWNNLKINYEIIFSKSVRFMLLDL